MDSPNNKHLTPAEELLKLQPDALLRANPDGEVSELYAGTGNCAALFSSHKANAQLSETLPPSIADVLKSVLSHNAPSDHVHHEVVHNGKNFEICCKLSASGELLAAIRDITHYKSAENRMRELAFHDSLTGLPNRSFFARNFESAIERAKRSNKQVAVLFIDLDRFKRINDTLGHSVGDELLVEVAERLSRCIRGTDLMIQKPDDSVARLGGDEFTIVASDLDSIDNVKTLAQRLIQSLAETVKLAENELVVTPSIGISVFPNDGENVEALLKNADAAMYHAKSKGRNNFQFFDAAMNDKALLRLKLESQLRKAIENGDLYLEFQPQLDSETLDVCAVESLARWHHKELGVITPEVFIPIAEESGLIIPLGDTLMELACKQLDLWAKDGLDGFRLAMNFSGLQFRGEHIVSSIERLLQKYNLPANRLELEITEGVIAKDPVEAVKTLTELHELGIRLTVDDFGTGYTSLQHLSNMPLDALKIDRLFTADINSKSAGVADAVISIAKHMNLDVIAEGIETQESFDYIKSQGCTAAQGYLFSRAISADECFHFILENNKAKRQKPTLTIVS